MLPIVALFLGTPRPLPSGGARLQLTGGQVMGLHAHAFRAPSRQVAVKDSSSGERVVLTAEDVKTAAGALATKTDLSKFLL